MRPIDADRALEIVRDQGIAHPNAYHLTNYATLILREAPTIDVAPVRHRHWISLTECANEGVYCSICKKKVWKSEYAWCSKRRRNKLQSNYCPSCGARMDDELNE